MSTSDHEKILNPKECDEIAETMNQKYRIALRDRRFAVRVRKDGPGVLAEVVLQNQDHSYCYPVEGRLLFEQEGMKPGEAALFLIDYIDQYFEEFLLEEEENLYLTIDWSQHSYDAVDFELRGQILNKRLENLADEILRAADMHA